MRASRIIAAVVAACVAFACAVAALTAVLPSQGALANTGKNYGYVYSGAKSSSVAFATAAQTDTTYALFGSSELSTPPSLVPEIPAVIFGQNNYGVDLLCIGEAYDQSLWQAIAVGAYANKLDNKKVVIIASPSWFFDGGMDNSVFQTRFSYPLYQEFAANTALTESTKDYVRSRLAQQGIDDATVGAPWHATPIDTVNDAFFGWANDLRLRTGLSDVVDLGFSPTKDSPEATPDFAAIRSHALESAYERSTNEWGLDDDFYANNVDGYQDQIRGKLSGETFTNTPEYDDFGLLLRVATESGLEPLVVVSPMSGDYYDFVGIDAATRRSCYDHILEICSAYGVAVADFSPREYEKYFMHDQVHFGWTGWVDVEEAIYTFVKEG